jgi:transcriptional regulator with XRE-family HTH domain
MDMSAIEFLRERLKKLRKRHGLSQERFAETANINYKYYQSVEAGRRCELRLSTLEKLAKAYGIRLDQLLNPSVPKTFVKGQQSSKKTKAKRKK